MARARRVRGSGQRGLDFEVAPSEGRAALGGKRFENPKRASLAFGDGSLSRYLEMQGEDWVLRLVKFLEAFDWAPFEVKYDGQKGRVPIHPQAMLGLVLYGIWKGRSSLRELESLARLDLGGMYICGGIQPDFSTLARFYMRHEEYLSEHFFADLTRRLMATLKVKPSSVAIDGTVVEAVSSRHSLLRTEAARVAASEARAEAIKSPEDAQLRSRAELAETVAAAAEYRQAKLKAAGKKGTPVVSPSEPEAVVQPRKDGPYRPAYVVNVAVAEGSQLITGVDVRGSGEAGAVPSLLTQHQKIADIDVERMLADGSYATTEVLRLALASNIDLIATAGRGPNLERKGHDGKFSKAQFKYDEESDTYVCPAGRTLSFGWQDTSREEVRRIYTTKCDGCALRAQCTTNKKNRTITRFEGDELKEALRVVMEHPAARRRYAQRKAIIEPVFANLKAVLGLTRFRVRGQTRALLTTSLHCAVFNLCRAGAAWAAAFFALLAQMLRGNSRVKYPAPERGDSFHHGAFHNAALC